MPRFQHESAPSRGKRRIFTLDFLDIASASAWRSESGKLKVIFKTDDVHFCFLASFIRDVWQHEANFVIIYIFKLFFVFRFEINFGVFGKRREAEISASKIPPINYSRHFNSISYSTASTTTMIESFVGCDQPATWQMKHWEVFAPPSSVKIRHVRDHLAPQSTSL